jgi:hypothetical protein
VVPWLVVGVGAVVYWSVALGVGLPALGRLLGSPHPPRRVVLADKHCLETVTTDGRVITFGECIDVRFINDSPDIPGPGGQAGQPWQRWDVGPHRTDPVRHSAHPVLSGPDPEIEEVSVSSPMPEAGDSIGRTSY